MLIAQFIKQTFTKKNLQPLLLILFLPQIVFSASYSAVIVDLSVDSTLAEITIQINNTQQIMTLQISTDRDKKLMARLNAGDYLAFQGQKLTMENTLKLLSIDYVGLKTLLGTWTGNDGLCYHFSRFTQITVYEQNFSHTCLVPTALDLVFPSSFKYFITPNESNWDVLVGNKDVYYTAEFQFIGPNNISAQIFDTETGEIVSELNLWR